MATRPRNQCVIDCHNYCRYQISVFQADGSVIGR